MTINYKEAFKNRIAELLQDEIVTGDDGYLVWWPSKVRGYYSAEVLRYMADLLDNWNKAWDEQVQRDVGQL